MTISEHWINFIKGFMIGARFDRGRVYAKKGNVVELKIEPGVVRAKVQGSKRKPYDVEIKFQTLSREAWEKITESLKSSPLICAQILDGMASEELESFLAREGGSLFPKLEDDSSMECSCPDWSVPCKHLVAIFFRLGEEFERDPFLIFKLRGIEKKDFLPLIGMARRDASILDEFPAPSWAGKCSLKETLAPVYARASEWAEKLLSELV